MPRTLSDEDVNAIAAAVVALMREATPPARDVLTLREAIAFVGKDGLSHPKKAFLRWRAKHQVRPCDRGRYSLRSLKAAMEREARKTYTSTRDELFGLVNSASSDFPRTLLLQPAPA